MATAVHSGMTMAPFTQQQNQCVDPSEQDFFDFAALPSPTPHGLKREASANSTITSPTSPSIDEDVQVPAKPSHEYDRFKQQTGIPSGSLAGLNPGYNSGFMFSSTGLDEMAMMNDSMMDASWNSGMNMDSGMNMGMDLSQNGYMFNDASQDDFVDPSAIQQQEAPNVRVWPGMHQQQAALAKAQQQAQQQRQQQIAHQKQQQALQAQQQARLSVSQSSARKASSPLSDARTEETIARVVAQIRADSQNASSNMHDDGQGLLPHVIRAKKDEEDMDEDERLLASEEGKKLSSKERRQLRNKVSARAFRSRRKEYIGQLEGDLNVKQQENNDLRLENRYLKEENERSRKFIESLLRHKAFVPYLDELSRDEALLAKPMQPTAAPVMNNAAPAPFPNQQQFSAMSQPESTHIGMTMIPETPFDFSTLNLNNNVNGNNWGASNGFNNFQQPRVFAVLELPEGPSDPLDVEAMSGKGHSTIFNTEDEVTEEEVKPDFPVIERPVQTTAPAPVAEDDDDVPEDDLYRSSPASTSTTSPIAPIENHEQLFANPEKTLAHYSLVIPDEAQEVVLAERLQRRIAAAEPVFQRIAAITSMLDL